MKLGVLTNLFAGMSLDEALTKFEALGIEAADALDPSRHLAVPAPEEKERQGPQRVVHQKPHADDAQHIEDFFLHPRPLTSNLFQR